MKNFISEESTLVLEHDGYSRITGKTKEGCTTLLEVLQLKAEKSPTRVMLGAINKELKIEYMNSRDVNLCAKKFAQFLIEITSPGEIVGIASANRPEWIIAEYATYYSNCVNAPLYSTFKEEALSYVLSITQMRVLVAAPTFAKMIVEKVLTYVPSGLIKLEHIILMENDKEVYDLCTQKGMKVNVMDDLIFSNKSNNSERYTNTNHTICYKATRYFNENTCADINMPNETRGLPKSEDVATVCFTSGTTGVPKGVQLTHYNFISQIQAFAMGGSEYEIFKLSTNSVYFSCLPLSHVFERVVICNCLSIGAKICFFRGDKTKIGEDINIVQPTFIAVVPKILLAFYQKIEEQVSKKKFYERFIYRIALSLKMFLQNYNIYSVNMIDNTVFKKIPLGFGGKIKDILCGGASVDPYLIKYLTAVMNTNIFQGYGQTEGLGANILSTEHMRDFSSVGIPFPSIKLKLVDLEDGNGTKACEKALLLKGHAITKGYFEPSTEVLKKLLDTGKYNFKIESILESPFDEDGWLITGDVVKYVDQKVYVVGRTKDLVKLDNGEYISPESIENGLRETDLIKDVFISKIKDSDEFVALVSAPSENATLLEIAKYLNTSISSLKSKKVIPKCIDVTQFAVVRQSFAEIDNGLLFTPTLKKKRFIFSQKFNDIIAKSMSIKNALNNNLADSEALFPETKCE